MKRALLVLLVVTVGATGCADPQHPRRYPRWTTQPAKVVEPVWRDCVGVRAFVRKSGKQGIGVTLEVRSRTDCAMVVTRAHLALADGTVAEGELLPQAPLRGRSLLFLWMPVRFDGDAAWNRGTRSGRLVLELAIAGVAQEPVTFPLTTLWDGAYPR